MGKPIKGRRAEPLEALVAEVRSLVESARRTAFHAVNSLQVLTNFEIGRRIVEREQEGEVRAEYGAALIGELSLRLTKEFGRGFSRSNLEYMRKFYVLWKDRIPAISQKASGKSAEDRISQKPSGKFPDEPIFQKPSGKLPGPIRQKASGELAPGNAGKTGDTFALSWSHYVVLMGIEDPAERAFYEIESAQSDWSQPELKRQVASCLYERLALSRDKRKIRKLSEEGHRVASPEDMFKEPLVLEFLGLEGKSDYSESDLESAIIDRLQSFLLELGKGFLFEARQKRFSFGDEHYHVDLVFYNRLLKCYVLFDLKLDRLTHQDLGQMQMYVNHYDRSVRTVGENPTIGVVLCKRKKDALVKLTLPENAPIYASRYQLYLPTKDELRERLLEWSAGHESPKKKRGE